MSDHASRRDDAPGDPAPPGDITLLIDAARAGGHDAQERLISLVYEELRRIAAAQMRNERGSHTLGATALVSESYLRLFRNAGVDTPLPYGHRRAFYQAAATAMRRILIDHARAKGAVKRAGGRAAIDVDAVGASIGIDPSDLLSLDDAISRLEGEDERAALVVRLRFFGGRQLDDIAEMLGVNTRTVKRDWEFARARLQQLIEGATEA